MGTQLVPKPVLPFYNSLLGPTRCSDRRMARLERKAHNLLKLVLEVAGTSLVKKRTCNSQRLVLSAKGKEQLNTSLWYLQVRIYCTAVTIKGNKFRHVTSMPLPLEVKGKSHDMPKSGTDM